ncbi:uncharacterized protein CCOS01_08066 [Colletotrichum costaricense]|uniref:Uncharacterized protein n=1 Tax=Colletotrichum costaricense TaxID=1209916 RepID=A0AAI9YVT1_9PEZI|nr:uncharacterized protein CCOS01_08066 [Colletotrichum costaricense]KAK1525648.1 hypothetical protein CCOS01_08066 [Colletotrichum costaricense]
MSSPSASLNTSGQKLPHLTNNLPTSWRLSPIAKVIGRPCQSPVLSPGGAAITSAPAQPAAHRRPPA